MLLRFSCVPYLFVDEQVYDGTRLNVKPESVVCIPLHPIRKNGTSDRSRVIGAVEMIRGTSLPRFKEEDVIVAEKLVENAGRMVFFALQLRQAEETTKRMDEILDVNQQITKVSFVYFIVVLDFCVYFSAFFVFLFSFWFLKRTFECVGERSRRSYSHTRQGNKELTSG